MEPDWETFELGRRHRKSQIALGDFPLINHTADRAIQGRRLCCSRPVSVVWRWGRWHLFLAVLVDATALVGCISSIQLE